ncbi:MAG TPA: amidohydrolase family protein, partial [Bdellovibrionota bacterium]|nr:amidohydrolase family protein [Bdellovibrionota bacterium]
ISTDWNPGTSMSGDLLLMMTIAMSQMKMTIAETFAAVTYNGARALGFSDRGSIEIGKRADLAIFDAPSFIHLPYHFGTNHLSGLVIKGKSIK